MAQDKAAFHLAFHKPDYVDSVLPHVDLHALHEVLRKFRQEIARVVVPKTRDAVAALACAMAVEPFIHAFVVTLNPEIERNPD